ncbi:MAG: hypothetical protein ACPGWR_09305 [Ardenticatenaceae bacterium]
MNTINSMTDKQETLQQKPTAHQPLFKVKSGLKAGFEYTLNLPLDRAAELFGNASDSVQSKISEYTS